MPSLLFLGLFLDLIAAYAGERPAIPNSILPEGPELALLRAWVAGEMDPRVAEIAADPVISHVLATATDGAETACHILRVLLLVVKQEYLHKLKAVGS